MQREILPTLKTILKKESQQKNPITRKNCHNPINGMDMTTFFNTYQGQNLVIILQNSELEKTLYLLTDPEPC